jgi:hypothetical protein
VPRLRNTEGVEHLITGDLDDPLIQNWLDAGFTIVAPPTLTADEGCNLWDSHGRVVALWDDRRPIFGESRVYPISRRSPVPAKPQLVEGRARLRNLEQLLKSRKASLARAEPGSEIWQLREQSVHEVVRALEAIEEELA